jgi:hypothetical protein
MTMLASRGEKLAGETDLKEALRVFMLQWFIDPEWAISFQAEGNEVIALKRHRRTKLGSWIFFDEFNAAGSWQATGSLEMRDPALPQDVANAIARLLGSHERSPSDMKKPSQNDPDGR